MLGKKKKKKQIEELVSLLEKEMNKFERAVRNPLMEDQMDIWKKPEPSIYDYDKAKWEDTKSPIQTNVFHPKKYLDLTETQKRFLEESQKEEFMNNMSKLSKIIEAKRHDEENSVSMYRGFKELKESGLI